MPLSKDEAIQAVIAKWRAESEGVAKTATLHGQQQGKAICAEELAAIVGPPVTARVRSGMNLSDMFT